jgi:hypothetical protein
VIETTYVHSSDTKTKLGKALLSNNDSESISEPSTDIVLYIELNDKHSLKINLKYSTK